MLLGCNSFSHKPQLKGHVVILMHFPCITRTRPRALKLFFAICAPCVCPDFCTSISQDLGCQFWHSRMVHPVRKAFKSWVSTYPRTYSYITIHVERVSKSYVRPIFCIFWSPAGSQPASPGADDDGFKNRMQARPVVLEPIWQGSWLGWDDEFYTARPARTFFALLLGKRIELSKSRSWAR